MENNTAQIEARIQKLETETQRRGGGGSIVSFGASTVVWRPGGVTAGNVYATWAEVVAAVAALNGYITVGVDTSLAAAVIPLGAWDLRPAGVVGPVWMVGATPAGTPTVTTAAAAVSIDGLSGLQDIIFDNVSTVDVITVDATHALDFYMNGNSTVFQDAPGATAFIRIVAGGVCQISMRDFSFISTLGGGTNAIQQTAGALQFNIEDGASLDTDQYAYTAGTVTVSVSAGQLFGFIPYQPQAGAPLVNPVGMITSGTAAIVVGTGKTAAIPAFIAPGISTRILVTLRTPAGDAATIKYAALSADRVVGAPGSFQISALDAAGGGAVNGADTSTIDWEVIT